MRLGVGYIRVSTEAQCGDDRFGIESQKHAILTYSEKNDIKIVEWFIERGVSGAKDNRPEFTKILNGEIKNPPIEVVVVAKNDRVARDIQLYYVYKYMLGQKNLELISVSEDFGQFGMFAPVLEAFLASMAQVERELITSRTSGGRAQKASKGGYSGGRPAYGYQAVNGELAIVEDEAEVVRMIFRLRDEGMTYEAIANALNEQGILTRKGNQWKFGTVRTVLENEPLYRGMYKYGDVGEWVPAIHEPILKNKPE